MSEPKKFSELEAGDAIWYCDGRDKIGKDVRTCEVIAIFNHHTANILVSGYLSTVSGEIKKEYWLYLPKNRSFHKDPDSWFERYFATSVDALREGCIEDAKKGLEDAEVKLKEAQWRVNYHREQVSNAEKIGKEEN